KRGFNQSLLIARELSRLCGLPLAYGRLKRERDTGQQVGLKAAERKENVKGAFRLEDAPFFKGKSVLLVDDVMTTGATLNECAKLLRRAGAEVEAVTVARAVSL
ncbi:partial orotate phosphoribosyltransferase, partial [Anaerolineae bacterium]